MEKLEMAVSDPPKRKKGRPPKKFPVVPYVGEMSIPSNLGRKRKSSELLCHSLDESFVGQQVHGVLDGSFDAGYFLTVRVGDTQTVLRGAVFEPNLCSPISESNDIAPNVRFVGRAELFLPAIPKHAATACAPHSTSCQDDHAKEGWPHSESGFKEVMAIERAEGSNDAGPLGPTEINMQVKSQNMTSDSALESKQTEA